MNILRGLTVALSLALSQAAFSATEPQKSADKSAAQHVYIVTFAEPGLLYYAGGTGNLKGTAPASTGNRKLNVKSAESQAYDQFLSTKQQAYLADFSDQLDRAVVAKQNYKVTLSGVAVSLTEAEAAQIASTPGVVKVERDQSYPIDTDAGPTFIGAPGVWDGTNLFSAIGTRGQGVTIATLDTGVNLDHPSFANDASCGFSAGTPKLASAKDCTVANCVGGNPEDVGGAATAGHGVHTASTSGGNTLTTPLTVVGVPLRYNISGVAPCATVRTYKVCSTSNCDGNAILAGIQAAITDQVDVMNFSIGGGTNPWVDADRSFLDMVNADILVSASAGNTRAAPNDIPVGAVNHRGPWVLTVANSSHDRVDGNPISVAGGPQNSPGVKGTGMGFTATTTAQVASAAALGNEFGCTDTGGFAPGSMTGRIALIQRGPLPPGTACGFAEKSNNAAAAGAIATIIYNHTLGPIPGANTDGVTIPTIIMGRAPGYAIRDFLVGSPSAQMTVSVPEVRLIDPSIGDFLNAGSLRGPNIPGNTTVGTNSYVGSDTTKPDITGPGTNIYAAVHDFVSLPGSTGQFGFLTGTSMSSPHLAGAAALLRAVNPTWTVPEVKSALQLYASVPGIKADGVNPWDPDDVGNGRIDISRAARGGLVMHETFANFLAANPASAADQVRVRALNLPSLRNTTCVGVCTFVRTFRNTRSTPTTWYAKTGAPTGTTVTVVPSSFTFNGGLAETQVVTVTVTVTALGAGLRFGDVRFSTSELFSTGFENTPVPDARLTLAITGSP